MANTKVIVLMSASSFPHLTPCYQLYQPKKEKLSMPAAEVAGTEDFLFLQVSNTAKLNTRMLVGDLYGRKTAAMPWEHGHCFRQRKCNRVVNGLCASACAFAALGQTDATFPLPSALCSFACARF